MKAFFVNLWRAYRRSRNRKRRWAERTCYTWNRPADYRDALGNFRRENGR